jgi:AAA domain
MSKGWHDIPPEPEADGKKKKPDPRAELEAAFKKTICSCTELDTVNIPARSAILGDWFLEGDLGFIFAFRGTGKTFMALAMSSAMTNGGECGPWCAKETRKVLYIDGEMPYDDFRFRSKGLECNGNLSVLHHEVLFHLTGKVLNLADPITQEMLTAWMIGKEIKVVILDNLSCLFTGVKENDADAWELVLHWLLTLRRNRIAVIVLHHSGINKERMRGTSRREDAAFWVMRLDQVDEVEPKRGARFLSRFTKDRNSKTDQAPIRWSFETIGELVAISYEEARSIDVFRQWVEDGLESASDIAEEMGVTKGYVSQLAARAIKEGWLEKQGRNYVLIEQSKTLNED